MDDFYAAVDTDALFDRMSAMVQAGYAAQMKAGQ